MYEIVLSGPLTEFSDYNLNAFIAFAAGFPSKIIPRRLLRRHLYPPTEYDERGVVKFAPYGLRKIETILQDEFGEDKVVTIFPEKLPEVVDEKTKVVGLTLHDPLGLAYVSTTYSSLVGFGSVPITAMETKIFFDMLKKLKKRYGFKVIAGGVGAWQIADMNLQDEMMIDTIVIGDGEEIAADLFKKALKGEKLPRVVKAITKDMDKVPTIRKPVLYGAVEITRGCGKGCAFCAATMRKRYSFPMDKIMKEVEINARNGTKMIMLVTEDIFLYQSLPGFKPNREALEKLIKRIASTPGVEYIQVTHSSWPAVVYDPKALEVISPILYEKTFWEVRGKRYIGAIIGIESGSVRLMTKYMRGKAKPLSIEKWPEIVVEGVGIYNDNQWYPGGTIILGMPGETEDDALRTLELVDDLKDYMVVLIPLLFVPITGALLQNASRVSLKNLGEVYWEIIWKCWRHNLVKFAPEYERKVRAVVPFVLPYYLYYHGRYGVRALLGLSGLLKENGWKT